MASEALLTMEDITKSFPGVRALNGVSLSVKQGEVHALMGENGAGKSTLMKCLFGIYKKDSGRILLNGTEVDFKSSREALEGGVAMVHQELNQALKRSVADNIWLGRYPKKWKWLPFVDEHRMQKESRKLFDELGLDISPRDTVGTLSVSKRQMLEIAKAVSYGSKIIVFDEPTSSLNEAEAAKLFDIINMLKNRGCGIIYISHKMEEILRISDTVTIMRDGEHIATRESSSLSSAQIIKLMVGRELSQRYPDKNNSVGNILFEAKRLSARYNHLSGVSLRLHEGEILGVAGLDGAGRTELLESIFGICRLDDGEMELRGKKIDNRTPRSAIKNGFALVTEERRHGGIFGILSVLENTVISSLASFRRGPLLSKKAMLDATEKYIKLLGIKTPDGKAKIRTLSGGNQQKVIFARWLLTKPQVFLLDEPTRGIDVGAKYEIYKLMLELAENGRGIILVSSEMPELLGLCDRILVMSGGKAAGILPGNTSQEKIMELATKYV